MQYVEQAASEVEDLEVLVSQLRSLDPRRRRRARKLLQRAGIAAIGPLLKMLDKEGHTRRSRRVLRYALAALTLGGYLWWASHLSQPSFWPLALVLLIPFIAWVSLNAASPAQVEAAQILASLNDVRAIGPLAEALEFVDLWQISGTDWIAAEALCRLLPQLKPEDGALLNERQRACLYHVLGLPMPQYPQLSIAILNALARIGDIRALPTIMRLSNLQPMTLAGKQIRDTAQECLVTLQERFEIQRATQTLLRPASADTPPDLLLHPAENPQADPAELLRPTDSN